MKGSELGPLLFLVFINDLLTDLQKSSLGAKIGDLTISCLGFADDLVLTAESPENLQLLINKCECWVKKNLMTFNTDKCKVMVFNRPSSNLNFSIYGKQLSMVNSYKYLGIVISNTNQTNLYTDHFKKTIEKAEKRLHCIAHFGFHRDGLRPKTAIKLYKLMVRPILEYGSQVLTYRKYFLKSSTDKLKDLYKHTVFGKKLEHLQTKALKNLIRRSKSISPVIVRLFSVVEPLISRLDMLKLLYFWKLLQSNDQSINSLVFRHRKNTF